MHWSESCSVRIVNLDLWRHSLSSETDLTTSRKSLCVVSYVCLALFRGLDQYHKSKAGPPGCSCNKTHRTFLSQASISNVYRLFRLGSNNICSDISRCCTVSRASISASFSLSIWKCWSFSNLRLNNAGMGVKLGTSGVNMLQRLKKDLSSVIFVGYCCNLRIASVAFVVSMPSLSGCITWPK